MPRSIPVINAAETTTPPPFPRIGIVGLGLIGGSVALAARRLWSSSLVVGVDRNAVLEDAQRAHAVDVAADDLGMLAEVDLVVLAAPVLANVDLLRQLPDVISGSAVITDVGSTKQAIVEAARELPERLTFVGGHPLAGAARGGIRAASGELFRTRPWILTPHDGTDPTVLGRLETFIEALGAEPRRMTPAEHDVVMAWVSHLPQLTASALMRVVGDAVGPEGLALSGRGLRDTTRLAGSPPHIWVDVCATNGTAVLEALDRLIDELHRLRQGLTDRNVIEDVFDAAVRWRGHLPD